MQRRQCIVLHIPPCSLTAHSDLMIPHVEVNVVKVIEKDELPRLMALLHSLNTVFKKLRIQKTDKLLDINLTAVYFLFSASLLFTVYFLCNLSYARSKYKVLPGTLSLQYLVFLQIIYSSKG
jgi:hypothetical protein